MAIKAFNSDYGFSVGNTVIDVIYANGDITTGNITVNNHSNLGSVSNITITGGNANYVIQTDGQGNLSWANISVAGGIANGTSNISIPVANGNIDITSNGNTTLTVTPEGANVQGNFAVSKHSNLGAIGNITITGGNANYVIQTDGQGNLSWADAGGAASISNGTSNINIPVANGNIELTANGNTTLTVTSTGADIQGNINVANGFSVNGFYGNAGQFLTANGNNGFNWQSHFFTGNVPPEAPIPGDIWYYVDDTAVPPTNVLYMWIFDGTSEYFYDFLPPTFLNT
jgi:ribosomal 30S subunit maturation factor RimM